MDVKKSKLPVNLPFNFKEPQVKSLFLIILLGLVGIYLLMVGGGAFKSGSGPGGMGRAPSQGQIMPGGDDRNSDPGSGAGSDEGVQDLRYVASGAELERKTQLERSVTAALSEIRGAGKVTVSITFAGTRVNEYASNLIQEKKTTEERDKEGVTRVTTDARDSDQLVLIRGGPQGQESPVLLETREPEIRGVIVMADGAADPGVKLIITRAVETLLGVPPHKVLVLPRKR
ncbi:MAG TPA: hypothetical protein GXX51_10540 [Firmicutes bacterium]|nr:hypothetical protein [Bacillota bacterium]